METRTAISVVTPVCNGADILPRALASALAQAPPPAEVIVVDDGSTDGSADVARSFGDSVRVLRQANAGVSAARNRGAAECASDLVAFLDADDEWKPGFLETISLLAQRHPDCPIYCTGYERVFADGSAVPCLIRGLPETPSPWSGILPDYFRIASRSDPPAFTSATVVRRNVLSAIGGFPVGVTAGEDLLTWARIAVRGPVAFSEPCEVRFMQPQGATPLSMKRLTRVPQRPDVVGRGLRELLPLLPVRSRPCLRAYIALWHKMRASCYISLGRYRDAAREVIKAISSAPFSGDLYVGMARSVLRKPFR